MTITINGERREIPDGMNVTALLRHLGMAENRVAIERNRDILPRARWEGTAVGAGDAFEIVQFVGGGQVRAKNFLRSFRTWHDAINLGETDNLARVAKAQPSQTED